MNPSSHQQSVRQYLNDMVGVERDILNALKGQIDDERVQAHTELAAILGRCASESDARLTRLKELSKEEGGDLGAALKEGVTAITGTLAGLYGKMREHPLSRMVRDDIVALDVCAVSYSMLHTLGLAAGHGGCAILAEEGLRSCPPLVIALTDLLPVIVAEELAEDEPLANPAAAQVALAALREAWHVSRG